MSLRVDCVASAAAAAAEVEMNVRRLSIGDLRSKRRHELNAVRTAWSTVRAH